MESKTGRRRTEKGDRERGQRLLGWVQGLIRFFLAATLATGQVMGGGSPFALALVGASGPGGEGFCALLGAVLGYLASRGLEDGLRYAACSVLIFSVSFAFYDVKLCRGRLFMPLAAGALNAATGLATLAGRSLSPAEIAAFVGEVALTVLAVYAFRCAFSLWDRGPGAREPGFAQRLGLILLGLAVLTALARLELLERVSAGRLCAALVSVCAGWAAGPGAGAAVGLTAGVAMDLSTGGGGVFAVSYALAALSAGLLRGRRRVMAAAGFVGMAVLTILWDPAGGAGLGAVYEAAWAGLAFLLIPQRVLEQAGALLAPEPAAKVQWSFQAASGRLRRAAEAFDQLFATLRSAFADQDNGEDPSVIYDRAANRVCAGCVMRERCWQREYQDTYDLLGSALPPMLERRRALAADFPQRFRDRCCRFSGFLTAVNEELSAHLLRRRYHNQVGRNRRAVCEQYGDMARVLQDAAAAMAAPLSVDSARTRRLRQYLAGRELRCQGLAYTDPQGRLRLQLEGADAEALDGEDARRALEDLLGLPLARAGGGEEQVLYRQQEPLAALAGAAGRQREGQSVSGDAFTWFKNDQGVLYLLLCDGMGSGPEARRESELCLRLLEKFLQAGVSAQNALKTLDQALALREEETGSFSTVDLLELDLYSGQGALYKLGAAPSYLKEGGSVRRLAGRSLPAGLSGASPDRPDRLEFRAEPGDCVVLVTDGVLPGDDRWLRAALSGFDGGSPAALAQELVDHGQDGQDDRTALVLRVGLRAGPGQGAEV